MKLVNAAPIAVTLATAGSAQAPVAPPSLPAAADLTVPPGFKVSVFASDLAGARLMTVSPEGVLLVARRPRNEVVELPDADKDGLDQAKAIDLMAAQPSMIKRPVLEVDGELLVGFKPEAGRRTGESGGPAELYSVGARLSHDQFRTGRASVRLDWILLQRLRRGGCAPDDDSGREG